MQFIVQAVNGVGLVSLDDNQGSYYQPDKIPAALQTGTAGLTPTSLTLTTAPAAGAYGSSVQLAATLTGAGLPVSGEPVSFTIGGSSQTALTRQRRRDRATAARRPAGGVSADCRVRGRRHPLRLLRLCRIHDQQAPDDPHHRRRRLHRVVGRSGHGHQRHAAERLGRPAAEVGGLRAHADRRRRRSDPDPRSRTSRARHRSESSGNSARAATASRPSSAAQSAPTSRCPPTRCTWAAPAHLPR